MAKLRVLKEKHLSEVNHLLVSAFSEGRREDGYAETRVPPCNPQMLEMYLSSCPNGCFIFEDDGIIVATVFSHIYGSTGWLGPIAVKPSFRGNKFGREITDYSIQYLKKMNCSTIGLETMPRSYKNLGFYIKLGFRPGPLTYELSKFISQSQENTHDNGAEDLRCLRYRGGHKRTFLRKAFTISDRASPGTDYTSFIQATDRYSFGESLLFETESEPVALVLAHHVPYSMMEKKKLYRVCLLIITGDSAESLLPRIVRELEIRAQQNMCSQIFFRIPALYWSGTRTLLEQKYRIVHSDLRMTLDGYPEVNVPGTIHFNRWE